MEKDEILARSRKNGPDEREQKIFLEAYNFSASVCILLCLGLMIYSMLRGERFFQYSLLIFATLSADRLYRFVKLRQKQYLIVGLIALIPALCFGVLFGIGW